MELTINEWNYASKSCALQEKVGENPRKIVNKYKLCCLKGTPLPRFYMP